jgi:altronate hydrolase
MRSARRSSLLDGRDSVAVLYEDAEKGDEVAVPGFAGIAGSSCVARVVVAQEGIPRGHKIALGRIAKGEVVLKYGHPIGIATGNIEAGSWVHTRNLASALGGKGSYGPPKPFEWTAPALPAGLPKSFMGFRRPDGRVGIRNEIWIIPTVGCINRMAENIAAEARCRYGLEAWAFTHPFGCSQLGDDLAATQRILSGLVRHPNAHGVLVLSLGCENNTLASFKDAIGRVDEDRMKFLVLQDVADETEEAMKLIGALAASMPAPEEIRVGELVVGMKCGGSDGFSGITANPLVGRVADLLVASGGSVALTEVPEMFGAEKILMDRSSSSGVFASTVALVDDFKAYFLAHGQEVYENPSPGNRDGGITTLEEKSLGCIRKGGSSPVTDVVPYGGSIRKRGLTLVGGPGNDLVSTTALTAAGVHLILFTTGRGTPFGAPVPTVKISSNSALAERKPGWIDFDAGRLISVGGEKSAGADVPVGSGAVTGKDSGCADEAETDEADMNALAGELFAFIVSVASGEKTKNERTGNRDIAIFKDGVTL